MSLTQLTGSGLPPDQPWLTQPRHGAGFSATRELVKLTLGSGPGRDLGAGCPAKPPLPLAGGPGSPPPAPALQNLCPLSLGAVARAGVTRVRHSRMAHLVRGRPWLDCVYLPTVKGRYLETSLKVRQCLVGKTLAPDPRADRHHPFQRGASPTRRRWLVLWFSHLHLFHAFALNN